MTYPQSGTSGWSCARCGGWFSGYMYHQCPSVTAPTNIEFTLGGNKIVDPAKEIKTRLDRIIELLEDAASSEG